MNIRTKITTIVTAGLVGAVLLTGCTTTPATHPTATKTATTAAADPSTTIAEVAKLPAGATLTKTQADVLQQNFTDAADANIRGYKLPSGQVVLVQANQPLPAPVAAAEQAKLAAIPHPTGTSMGEQQIAIDNALNASDNASQATGKTICTVVRSTYALPADPTVYIGWTAAGCPKVNQLIPVGQSQAAVVAEAQRRIAAQPDAANWALIVQP
jgi:hypothetical protein